MISCCGFLNKYDKTFYQQNKYRLLTSESANQAFASYVFLLLWVKFVQVGYNGNVFFERKLCQSIYETFRIFSIKQ